MKESQKDSPEHQEALIREYAAREGIELDYIYEDRDTATSIVARTDVQRMIEDAKRGEIRSIWFASLSRFSRDTLDALSLKRILVNALKVRLVSIEDGYDSAKKDDELLFGVKSVVNQNLSEQISISSRRGIRQSALKGNFIGSIPPYGYRKVVKDGRKTLEIVPEQAEVVRLIYDLYVNHGMGEKAITNFLNEKGIPTYKGGPWGVTSVQRILQNEHYTGYTIIGRYTTETTYNDLSDLMNRGKKLIQRPKSEWERTSFQTHEAIISREMFERAQEIRKLRGGGTRGGRRKFINVFAKMIFCAECGSAMVSMASRVRPDDKEYKYRYLMCSRRRRMGEAGCSNGTWIPYFEFRDELIEEILNRVRERLATFETGAENINITILASDYEKEKRKLEKRIEDNRRLLFEIRRQHLLGEIDKAQYEFEREQYEKEIAEAEKKLEQIAAEERRAVDIERIRKESQKAVAELTELSTYDDIEKTRHILMKLVKRIDVAADGRITIQTYI